MNQLQGLRRRRAVWLCATALTLVAAPALAQQDVLQGAPPGATKRPPGPERVATDEPGALDEVVVTATKQGAQTLQSVPNAISAITGDQLVRSGASSFEDYYRRVPGLAAVDLGPSSKKYILRGLNTQVLPGGGVQVQQYLDDVPLGIGGPQPDLRLYDIQRVEVLRGPQGTLYGVGSMGGTVRQLARRPDTETFGGYVEGTLSQTRKAGGLNHDLNGALNVPIIPGKLAVRAVAYADRGSGYIDNRQLGLKNVNNTEVRGARLTVLAKPVEALDIRLTYLKQEARADDLNQVVFDAAAVPAMTPPPPFPPSPARAGTSGRLESRFATRQPLTEDVSIGNLALDFDLGFATLSYSGSYMDRDRRDTIDVPFDPGQSQINTTDTRAVSQELRLASDAEDRLSWIVGAFRVDTKTRGIADYAKRPPSGQVGYNDITQQALFGQATFAVTETLKATAGIRYADHRKTADIIPFQPSPLPPQHDRLKEDNTSYKFNLSYSPNRSWLVYATAASGFREGGANGFNEAFLTSIGVKPADIAAAPRTYASDKLWNYEAGWKTTLLDGLLVLNGAVFHMDYSKLQSAVYFPGTGAGYVANLGAANIDGVELEFTAAPAEGLIVFGNVSKIRARVSSAPISNGPPSVPDPKKGDRLPGAPELSALLGLDYRRSLENGLEVFVGGDASYTGSTTTQVASASPSYRKTPDYGLLNLRTGVKLDGYTATVFVNNLTDERAALTVNNLGGDDVVSMKQPRTVGLRLRAEF